MITPQTLKGFRDFLPEDARRRQYVISTVKAVFESYGFEPLETPVLEYEEILTGKYGEEGDKLMYRFEDNGKRRVAMRYDQTVPLARVVAQYPGKIPMPFKRYQIQNVWRAENTQKGRFREFLQCDADIVGIDTPLSDSEVIVTAAKTLEKLGFKNYKILINDRSTFSSLSLASPLSETETFIFVRALDKIKKIGREKVLEELITKGFSQDTASFVLQTVENQKPTQRIQEIFTYLNKLGIPTSSYEFLPTLARGLDYYTGLIFEIEVEGYPVGSVVGGGRFNNLIGMFARETIPAVGFALGFDRIMEAMDELQLFPDSLPRTQALVTIFSPELKEKSIDVSLLLRDENINTELYLDENTKMEKQLKYADQKQIPFVVIIGPEEAKNNSVKLKNMKTSEQKTIPLEELPHAFK